MELAIVQSRNLMNEFLVGIPNSLTRRAYQQDLLEFFSLHQGAFQAPSDITVMHLISFREALNRKGLSSGTVSRKLSCIKSFLSWCVLQGFISVSPAACFKMKKVVVQNPTLAFTDEEVVSLINQADTEDFHGNNHKFMMAILFMLGLRRSELVQIRVRDIIRDRGVLAVRVVGKGDKLRTLPFNSDLESMYETFLEQYSVHTGFTLEQDDFLFQSSPSQKSTKSMNTNSIFRIVVTYAKRMGITRRVSPHSCRATAISHLLEKGVSPRDVADLAGHSSINTTIGYDKKRLGMQNSAAYKVKYGT